MEKKNKIEFDVLINQVFLGDVMDWLSRIPDESVDCVIADPDYNVGVRYEGKNYQKTFDEYIGWLSELSSELVRIVKPTGNLFLINYSKQNSYLRVNVLDQSCYEVLDYAWVYNTNVGISKNRFTTAHRSVLHCRKTKTNNFYKNQVALPYKNPNDKRIRGLINSGSCGRMPYSWFEYDLVKNLSSEKTIHACQIPQKLTELLVLSCTKPGDIVAIPFGGSGGEIDVCAKLGRQFVSAEIDPTYHRLIQERINTGEIPEKFKFKLTFKPKQ